MKTIAAVLLGVLLAGSSLGVAAQETNPPAPTLKGWLSDELCARGRAQAGTYTQTNPDCAKECVAKGRKIVLILPDQKQILRVANQDVARSNIGNYVEISGTVDSHSKSVHVDSLKLVSEGHPMCDVHPSESTKEPQQ
jgi:hypothetical protein